MAEYPTMLEDMHIQFVESSSHTENKLFDIYG